MRRTIRKSLIALAISAGVVPQTLNGAQAQLFLGDVATFAFNFCPLGWAEANGQLLPIAQNDALFNLLGTQYGGNGVTTFALPNAKTAVTLTTGATLIQCVSLQGVFPSQF
jgi:microcystin-dependent protein